MVDLTCQETPAQWRHDPLHIISTAKQEYASLIESITDYAIFLLDSIGRVESWNAGAERLKGYRADEIIGQHVSRFYLEEDVSREKPTKQLEVAAREGWFEGEGLRVRKDGSIFWAHVIVTALCDETGQLRGFSKVTRDVTERRQAARTLSEREYLLSQSQRIAHIGSWSLDLTTQRVTWTQETYLIYGVSRDTFMPSLESLIRLIHPDDRHLMQEWIDAAVAGNFVEPLEFRIVRPDGSIRVLRGQGELVPGNDTSPTLLVGTVQDITERKRVKVALQQSKAKFKTLFETANDAILIMNGETFSDCNLQAETLFRCGRNDIAGHSPVEFSPPRQPDGRLSSEKAAELIRAALNGLPQDFEWVHLRHDGTPFDAEVHLNRSVTPEAVYLQAIVQDITKRKQTEESLTLFRLLIDQSNDTVQIVDMETTRLVDVNARACLNLGYTREELLSMSVRDIDPTVDETVRAKVDSELLKSGYAMFQGLHRRKDGSTFPVEVSLRCVHLNRKYLVCAIRDITERKQAEEALLFKTALLEAQSETTIDGILVVDESDHIIFANRQFGLHFGVPDEVLSSEDARIVLKDIRDQVEASEAFIEKVDYLYSHRDEKSRDEFKLKNGKTFDRYSAPLVDSNARLRGRIWYFRDITDRKTAEERVQYLAYYDALTGLPNRTLLQDRLTKALANARRQKDKVAFLFLDLDRFKIINDTLGHAAGDLLLQDVAKRLESLAREQDTVVRFGGDEFLIMLTSVKDIAGVAVAAKRLLDTMTAEFAIQGHSLAVTCSLGISIFPEHGTDGETLIKNADTAMYRAKEQGCNNVQFFSAAMNAKAVEQLTLQNGLRLALENKELFLVYQPQMDVETGGITGLEVLLRWQHPELGLMPPDKFIPIAENSGLILPIGEWVLRTACSQARKWQDEGLPAVPVAVNVSAVQFRQAGFTDLVGRVLRETGLAPELLELEITESLLLSTGDIVFPVLQELKDMGVKLALDDFGTGYSSLSCLKYFPVSKLKIDRSFVRDIAVSPDDAAITTAIIAMAKHLKLTVIAEGVEDEFQMSFLRAHHCDEIQGYYFSRPLTVDAMAEMLRSTALHSPLDFAGHAEAI